MKKLLLLLLFPMWIFGQISTTEETPFPYGIKIDTLQTVNDPLFLGTLGSTGVLGKTDATLWAKKSDLPATYTTVVYVNTADPSTATIFDDENPPTVNDPLLDEDTDNLYIGTDGSTWVYSTDPVGYFTEVVPASSNFNLSGTSTDAGNNKTLIIERTGGAIFGGHLYSGGEIVSRKGSSNTVNAGSTFRLSNLAETAGNIFQLNASNGIDLWNSPSSGVWNKRFTFSSAGDFTANSLIKSGATSTNFLLAGGGDTEMNKIINAADFGFLPTATATTNAAALNAALLGGNKTVIVTKPGTYLLDSTVYLDDFTELIFAKGVVLQKAANYVMVLCNKGALTRSLNTNITIKGCKISVNGFQSSFSTNNPLYGLLGNICFFHANNINIYDTEILDLSNGVWGIQACTFDNLHINGFVLKGDKDGVHLGRGNNFVIENGVTETGDDAIALNAHDFTFCNPEVGNIENGVIRNITDLSKSPVVGYFSRLLVGAWVDWYSGIEFVKGDAVVHYGKTYRVEGDFDTTYYSIAFPTIPDGQNSVVAPEGFTLIRCSDDAVYSANILNVKYQNCELGNSRPISATYQTGYGWSRSIHSDITTADYPTVDIKMEDMNLTSQTSLFSSMVDIKSTVVVEKSKGFISPLCNIAGGSNSKLIVDKCDFRDVVGNQLNIGKTDLVLKNSISVPTTVVGITQGARIRSSDNIYISPPNYLVPLTGDYIVDDNVHKVYNGSVWVNIANLTDAEKANIQTQLDAKIAGTGTANYIPKFTGSGTVGNSSIVEDATSVDFKNNAGTSILKLDKTTDSRITLTKGLSSSSECGFVIDQSGGSSNRLGMFYQYGEGLFLHNGGVFMSASDAAINFYRPIINNSPITASSLIKSGGTSSQFLKADGSVDSNTYALSTSVPSLNQVLLAGQASEQTIVIYNAASSVDTQLKPFGVTAKSDITGEFTFYGRDGLASGLVSDAKHNKLNLLGRIAAGEATYKFDPNNVAGTYTVATLESPTFITGITTPAATISTTPTTSASTYDILTRNTSSGVVEKLPLSTFVAQTITDGVTTSAPSQDKVYDALALKAGLTTNIFSGDQYATSFTTNGNINLNSTNTGFIAPNNGNITFTCNHPSTPGWTSNAPITATSFIAGGVIKLKSYTVATLPAGTQGDSAYVTDALAPSYLVTIVGGGAIVTPVFYNGTNWVAH